MKKYIVKKSFLSRGRLWKKGEAFAPYSRNDEQHLLRTKQIEEMPIYPKAKEEKTRVSTKELKVEDKLTKLQKEYEEKSGEKPHHLWKESTLEKKIEELD